MLQKPDTENLCGNVDGNVDEIEEQESDGEFTEFTDDEEEDEIFDNMDENDALMTIIADTLMRRRKHTDEKKEETEDKIK